VVGVRPPLGGGGGGRPLAISCTLDFNRFWRWMLDDASWAVARYHPRCLSSLVASPALSGDLKKSGGTADRRAGLIKGYRAGLRPPLARLAADHDAFFLLFARCGPKLGVGEEKGYTAVRFFESSSRPRAIASALAISSLLSLSERAADQLPLKHMILAW
jgi:hypothetical protein